MRVADYIVSFVEDLGVKHIFQIPGGGSMYLNDAVGRNKNIESISTHHEQTIGMAVEAYSRITGSLGVGFLTTGPGGSNAITGVLGAWIDSIPCIFVSGQVALKDTIINTGLRQRGVQEAPIVEMVKAITKYAVVVTDPKEIKYHLKKAAFLSKNGRPGPVWLDIPLDVQGALINEEELVDFEPDEENKSKCDSSKILKEGVAKTLEKLRSAKRPVLWVGNGVRLAGAETDFDEMLERLRIPVLTTWGGSDLIDDNHHLFVGRPGLFGQRPANFVLQNADVILTIGNRISIPHTGFNFKSFAREATKIFVDIDKNELEDKPIKPEISVNVDAKDFITELNRTLNKETITGENDWFEKCRHWKERYPIVLPEYYNKKEYISSYVFIDKLSDSLSESDLIVTDMGTSFTSTFQTFKVKKGQRFFTSSGLASMGFGLPGAIGACLANNKKRTVLVAGEGSFMFNIQEMQTVIHYGLPIKIFLVNNGVYLAVKAMQNANFQGLLVGADKTSGVSFPNLINVAKAFGFKTERIKNHNEADSKIRSVLNTPGPVFCEVLYDPDEVLSPRLKTKVKSDGSLGQSTLEDMWPFLDRDEFNKEMIIKSLPE